MNKIKLMACICLWSFLFLLACTKTATNPNTSSNNNNSNPKTVHPALTYNYDGNTNNFIGQGVLDLSMAGGDIVVSFASLRPDSTVILYWNNKYYLTRTADSAGKLTLYEKDFSSTVMQDGDTLVLKQGSDVVFRSVQYKAQYIGSWQDLQAMRLNLSGDYSLMNDIVFPDPGTGNFPSRGFYPIGYSLAFPFTGSFQGNGHTISHLNCNIYLYDDSVAGMFGIVKLDAGKKISNFTIAQRSADAVSISSTAPYAVGTVVALLESGNLDGISVEGGAVIGNTVSGGLVGQVNGNAPISITNCNASCNVQGSKIASGGLIGLLLMGNFSIKNCYAAGNVSGPSAGGLICAVNKGVLCSLDHCYATGNVTASSSGNTCAGGLIGEFMAADTISNCYATGNVSSPGSAVGGLIGTNIAGFITASYASGNVSATGNLVGGFIGSSSSTAAIAKTIDHCYSKGNVTGQDSVGGFIGFSAFESMSEVYAAGSVHGRNEVGGIIGYGKSGDVDNAYAAGSVHGINYTGGIMGATSSVDPMGIGRIYYAGDTISGSSYVSYIYCNPIVSAAGLSACNKNTVFTSGSAAIDNTGGYIDVLFVNITTFTTDPGAAVKSTQPFMGFDFASTWQFNSGTWPALKGMP